MYLTNLIEWLEPRSFVTRWIMFGLIILLAVASTSLVLATGGTRTVFVHTMYVPIVMASLVFGIRGGIAAALLGGLLLGPLVPIETSTGQLQSSTSWIFRIGFFLLFGFITGTFSDLVRLYTGEIRWQLLHDESTRLPNKHSLLKSIREHQASSNQESKPMQLYLVDILNLQDNALKLGSGVGNLILCKLVQRLKNTINAAGDCFYVRDSQIAIIAEDTDDIKPAISNALSESINYEGIPLLLKFVWSCTNLNDALDDEHEHLRRVEVCLTEARNRNLSFFQYTPGLEQHARKNIELLGLFKHALDSNMLSLHYQPKYEFQKRNIYSVEALIRWSDPLRGFVPPGEFIPLIEDSELIHPLTLWVIDKALQDLAELRQEGIHLESVAVNISVANLTANQFLTEVLSLLEKHQLSPSSLELELTENAVMNDIDHAVATLNEIAAKGIAISIDDFGTGFSSLQYLDRMPIKSIKLDQLFIKNMLTDYRKCHIVETTTDLARKLELNLVAEGVETEEVETKLFSLGCQYGQGFFFSKPLPFAGLKAMMLQDNKRALYAS